MSKIKPFKLSLLHQIENLVYEKKSLQEVADNVKVNVSTLCKWIAENKELSDLIKSARTFRTIESLFKKANGYEYNETEARKITVGGKQVTTVTVVKTKHQPPDPNAAQLLLKHWHPEQWGDKLAVEHGGQVTLTLNPIGITDSTPKQINDDNTIDIETE